MKDQVSDTCILAMPDYRSRTQCFNLTYSQTTSDKAFALGGLEQRVTSLPVGLYHARKLRFLWSKPSEPTGSLGVPNLRSLFSHIRANLTFDARAPRRLLFSREDAVEPRVGDAARDLMRRMCLERGFTIMRFEHMDLCAQAPALFNTGCIVAPHGAGLVNTLFGRDDLRVLELNSELDGDGSMRACFFQIATERNQS